VNSVGIYTVTGTSSNGCTTTASIQIISNITIPPTPAADVTDPTCALPTGKIQTTFPISLSGNTISYTLTGITPPVAAQSNFTGIFNNLQPGIYELTATENGCISNAAQYIIAPVPLAPSSPQLQVVQASCNSTTGTINVQSPSPSAGVLYHVTPTSPSGAEINNTTGTFTGLPAGNYAVTVTVNGCTSSATNVTINNVTVPPAPVVTVTQPTCTNSVGSIQVTNIPTSTTTLFNLLPTSPSGPLQSNTSGLFTNVTSGTYNVTAAVFGCNSPITSVTILPQPVTPTLTVNSPSMCIGQPTNLVAVGTPAGGTFQWSGSSVTTGTIQVSPSTTQTYSVTYTLGECNAQAQATVTVINTPTVQLQNVNVCLGDSVTLVAMPSAPGGTFIWEPTGATTPAITVAPTQTAQYSVTYSIGQCSSQPAVATVTVNDNPTAEFLANPDAFSNYSEIVQFVNTSTGAVSYEWDFGDGYSSGAFNPSHLFQSIEEDGYTVTLYAISSAGCVDSFSMLIDQKDLLVYYVPNSFTPDNNDLNSVFKPVFTSGFDPYNYRMLIYNRWGELIFESLNAEVGWDGTYGTDNQKKLCQDGTYVWKIDFKRSDNDEYISLTGHVNLVR
jgi:gliding motility-associated-like protein